MALVTSYFDASGSPDKDFVVVGGLISTAEKWVSFSAAWQEVLDAFDVTALHMKDFAHSEGEFASWRWNEPQRIRFIAALITVIEDHVEFSVAAAVSMRDYEAVDKNYKLSEFMRPYSFAASTCSGAIPSWARSMGYDPESIAHVFEKGDTDQSDLQRSWKYSFPELKISPIFCKKRDCHPDPTVCAPIRPFEAADLIAYENFKGNIKLKDRGAGTIYLDELRKPLQRFLCNLPGAKNWFYSQRKEIEAVCSEYRVPFRSIIQNH